MSLHHLTHCGLSSCYLMANQIPIGISVAFLHDVSDILGMVSKTLHLIGWNHPHALVCFLIFQVGWFYFRLICLPLLIWQINEFAIFPADRDYLQPYVLLSKVMLSVLVFLHAYWQVLFIRIVTASIFKGEHRDL